MIREKGMIEIGIAHAEKRRGSSNDFPTHEINRVFKKDPLPYPLLRKLGRSVLEFSQKIPIV